MEKTDDGQFDIIKEESKKIVIIPEGTILYRGAPVKSNNTEEDLKENQAVLSFLGLIHRMWMSME